MGDGMEGPPVIGHDGRLHNKPRMLSQIDVASRFAIYSEFFVTEDAPHQEIGLRRAVTSHGIPREYYVDGGAAYIAGSLKTICAELGIRLLHAGPGDAEAKGVIERWHRTWRTEVGSELPDRPLHIDQLNEHHVAWVACEYNRRPHGTTGQAPLEHFLAGADNLRPVPLRPGPRAQIVSDIKAALVSLVDEHGVVPIVIPDEAQGLRDDLLHELYGLCSLDLDGRDYLTMWLVGHPRLARRLRLKQHSALAQRSSSTRRWSLRRILRSSTRCSITGSWPRGRPPTSSTRRPASSSTAPVAACRGSPASSSASRCSSLMSRSCQRSMARS